MGLDKLVNEHYVDFYIKNSKGVSQRPGEDFTKAKTKFFSTDIFESTVKKLAEKYSRVKDPFLIGNIGGSDAVLSLYANIAASNYGSRPNLLLIDRKNQNHENFDFRYLLTQLNPLSRDNYILDLFGLEKDDLVSVPDFDVLDAVLHDKEYDPQLHREILMQKAEDKFDDRLFFKFKRAVSSITGQLSQDHNYDMFVDGVLESIYKNPDTHYLTSDNLYRGLSRSMFLGNIRISNQRFHIHTFRADVSTDIGINRLRQILEEKGIKSEDVTEIDIAYIPSLMNGLDNVISFLEEEATDVIYSQRDTKTGERVWITKDSSEIVPSAKRVPGLSKYKEEAKKRTPLEFFVNDSQDSRLMFLSNLSIGYAYADEKTLEDYIDIANNSNVDTVVMGGAIYGPFFFRENARRMLLDPEFPTLDAQLREFKRVRKKFNGNVIYVMGENDLKICEDLFSGYVMELRRREQGDKNISLTVSQQRTERNSRYDDAQDIIDRYLYPYLLRLGKDATHFYNEAGLNSRIVELVTAFRRIRDGKPLRPADSKLINPNALEDSESFRVKTEFSDQVGDLSLRVTGNTQYSDVTQYKNPSVALEEITKMAENGTIEDILPEQMLVDTRQATQMFKIMGNRAIVFVPDMVDDKRYFDPNFSIPKHKRTKADRVHKRVTIANYINIPGSWILSGDFRDIMTVEPYFPKVIETMEEIQKKGQGMEEVKVAIIQDLQSNSITERPWHFLNYLDYAFVEQEAIFGLCIGDLIQGRNYREMPIENAYLGGLTISSMQRGVVNLMRPFFSLPHVKYWDMVTGNHEENTDRLSFGGSGLEMLEGALREHSLATDHNIDIQVPEFIYNEKGELIRAPIGFRQINSYNIVYSHKFSERGAGKGNSVRPTSHITSWMRNMGDISAPLDMGFGGHYHIVEMSVKDGKFGAILGCMAGESGYELRRQYSGAAPFGAILHFKEDGRFQIELISEYFLDDYKVRHPEISALGSDTFIHQAFTQEAPLLGTKQPEPIKLYRRHIAMKVPQKIGGFG